MAEVLITPKEGSKEEKYNAIIPQLQSITESENNVIANMANISAVLKDVFDFLWVGFYIVQTNQLVLGPFQGPIACTRINYGRGVCGTSWKEQKTIIVPNVDDFPGHIACSTQSKSEIVVPVFCQHKKDVCAVLDVDSKLLDTFDEVDEIYLTKIVELIKF